MKRKLLTTALIIYSLTFSLIACGNRETPPESSSDEALFTEIPSEKIENNEVQTEGSPYEEAQNESSENRDDSGDFTGEFTFDLPEGFYQSEDSLDGTSAIYYISESPDILSNISVFMAKDNGALYETTAAMYALSLQSELEAHGYNNVSVTVLSQEFYEINGRNVLKYLLEYTISDSTIRQGQCIIDNGADLIYVSYATYVEEGLADAMEACLTSIRFE